MEREPMQSPSKRSRKIAFVAGAACLVLAGSLAWMAHQQRPAEQTTAASMAHDNITTTVFWVGEEANASNANIPNASSTWVENWVGEFGGIDDPDNRCNMLPCDFTPKENAFYAAIPLNDLKESCKAKPWQKDVPGYDPNNPPAEGDSLIKNKWLKVRNEANGKTVFAQVQDAGPFGEDDVKYVLHGARPQARAGLDLSPAAAEYLKLDGEGQTSWEFVSVNDVPGGPWRQTITTSPPDCAR